MVVMLGWMLLTGLPVPAHTYEQPVVLPGPTAAAAPRVRVWTDLAEPYPRGETARVYLDTDEPAHLAVFRVDTDGRIRVLFPREPWGDTFVRDDRTVEITGGRGGRAFLVDDYPGVGYLLAVASPEPFEFGDITRGDYWDYRAIEGGRLRGDPYVLLAELARRITRSADYEYDIAPYYVERRYDYPRFVCYDCHAYASYEEWDPYERACTRFRMVIHGDPAHYAYRSGRGRNVVVPGRPVGPRYVFQDADPDREWVTRVPGTAAGERRDSQERGRTAADVGGRGVVPAPGVQSLGRGRPAERAPESTAARPPIEERRRPPAERRRAREADEVPEGLRPAEEERRAAPEPRGSRQPQSTGEPELRRRRP